MRVWKILINTMLKLNSSNNNGKINYIEIWIIVKFIKQVKEYKEYYRSFKR